MSTSATRPAARRTLPPVAAFAGAAAAFGALYLAAGAPSPLLVVFQRRWGFPEWELTVAFAAYAIGLLAALLVVGKLSDHIGRRPVLLVALLVELAAMLLFVFAPSIGWVIAARVVQGIATGAATSAFSASVVENAPQRHRRLAAILVSVAPAGGLGLGALLTGVAVQLSSHADQIVFTALSVVMAAGFLVAALSAETVTRQRGALRSLTPRVSVPPAARGEFAAAIPAHVAAWMFAGLFFGLGPTIVRSVFGVDSGLVEGFTIFLEPAAATAVGFVLGRVSGRRATALGGVAVAVGSLIVAAGVATTSLPLMWLGGIVGGAGFGASFSGAIRLAAPLAQPHERAGLFAGIYTVAYLSFGVPVIALGQLLGPLGLLPSVLGYVVVIAAVAVLATVAQWRRERVVAAIAA